MPPILQPAEHDLDLVASFVAQLIVFHDFLALLSTRDTGAYPFVFQRFAEPVCIVAAVPGSQSTSDKLPSNALAPI